MNVIALREAGQVPDSDYLTIAMLTERIETLTESIAKLQRENMKLRHRIFLREKSITRLRTRSREGYRAKRSLSLALNPNATQDDIERAARALGLETRYNSALRLDFEGIGKFIDSLEGMKTNGNSDHDSNAAPVHVDPVQSDHNWQPACEVNALGGIFDDETRWS